MKIINVLRYLFESKKPDLDDSAPWKKIFNIVLYIVIIGFISISISVIIINTDIFKEPFITEIKPAHKNVKINKIDKIVDNGNDDNYQILIAGENKGSKKFWKLSDKIYKYNFLHNTSSKYSDIINYHDSVYKMKYDNDNFKFITQYGAYGEINFNHGMEYINGIPLIMPRNKKITKISDLKNNNLTLYKILESEYHKHIIFYDKSSQNFTDGRFLKWQNVSDKKIYRKDNFEHTYFIDDNNKEHLLLIGSRDVFYPHLLDNKYLKISKLSYAGLINKEYFKNMNKYIFIKDKLVILDVEKQERCLIGEINLEKKSFNINERQFYGEVYKNYFIEKELEYDNKKGFLLRNKYNLRSDFFMYDTDSHNWYHPIKQEIKENIKQIIPFREGVLLILYTNKNILDKILYFDFSNKDSKILYTNNTKIDFKVLTDNKFILIYNVNNNFLTYNVINPDKSNDKNIKYKKIKLFYPDMFSGDNIKILGQYKDKTYFYDKNEDGGYIYTLNNKDFTLKKSVYLTGNPIEVKIDNKKNIFVLYMNDSDENYAYFVNTERKIHYNKKIELNEQIAFLHKKLIITTFYKGLIDQVFDNIYKINDEAYILESSSSVDDIKIMNIKRGTINTINFPYEIITMDNKYILAKDKISKNIYLFDDVNFIYSDENTVFNPKLIYSNSDYLDAEIIPKYTFTKDGVNIFLFKDNDNIPYMLFKEDNKIIISKFELSKDIDYQTFKEFTILSDDTKKKYALNFGRYIYIYDINKSANKMKLKDVKSFMNLPVVLRNNIQIISDYTEYYYMYNNKTGKFKRENIVPDYFDTVIKINNKKYAFDKDNQKVFVVKDDEIKQYDLNKQDLYLNKLYLSTYSDYFILGDKEEIFLYEYKHQVRNKIGKLKSINKLAGIYYMVFEPLSDRKDIIIQIDHYDNYSFIEDEMYFKKYEINKGLLKKFIVNNKNKIDVFTYEIENNKYISLLDEEIFIDKLSYEKLNIEEFSGFYSYIYNDSFNLNILYLQNNYYIMENNKLKVIENNKKFCEIVPDEVYFYDEKYFTDYNMNKVEEVYQHNNGLYYFDDTLYFIPEDFLMDFSFKIIKKSDFQINNISKTILGYKYKGKSNVDNLYDLNINIDLDKIFVINEKIFFENNNKYFSINKRKIIEDVDKNKFKEVKKSYLKHCITKEKSYASLYNNIKLKNNKFYNTDKYIKIINENKDFFSNKDLKKIDYINNKIILEKVNDSKIFINPNALFFENYDESKIINKIKNEVKIGSYNSESDYIIWNNKIINKNDLYKDIVYRNNTIYLENENNNFQIEMIEEYENDVKSKYIINKSGEYPRSILNEKGRLRNINIYSYENERVVKKRIEEFKDNSLNKITVTGIKSRMFKILNKNKKGLLIDNIIKKKISERQKKLYSKKLEKLNIKESEVSYHKEYKNKIFFFTNDGIIISIKKIRSPYYSLKNYLLCFPNLFYLIIFIFVLLCLFIFVFYRIILGYK